MIRVFPRRTLWTPKDDLAFVGDPPLPGLRPPEQPVRISVTFTWDLEEGQRLYRAWSSVYEDVQIGGPALGDPGADFVPGRFLKPGVTMTSRGCPRHCPWCVVPDREGGIREYAIGDGHIVQDNNLLACSRDHIERVFMMLRRQKERIEFNGGLDARLLGPWHIELLKTIRIEALWFACDQDDQLHDLWRIRPMLDPWSIDTRRCYVMIGYRESISRAEYRLRTVYGLGYLPFAQLYQGEEKTAYGKNWMALKDKWARPGNYRSKKGGEACPS